MVHHLGKYLIFRQPGIFSLWSTFANKQGVKSGPFRLRKVREIINIPC